MAAGTFTMAVHGCAPAHIGGRGAVRLRLEPRWASLPPRQRLRMPVPRPVRGIAGFTQIQATRRASGIIAPSMFVG